MGESCVHRGTVVVLGWEKGWRGGGWGERLTLQGVTSGVGTRGASGAVIAPKGAESAERNLGGSVRRW